MVKKINKKINRKSIQNTNRHYKLRNRCLKSNKAFKVFLLRLSIYLMYLFLQMSAAVKVKLFYPKKMSIAAVIWTT